VRTNLVSSNGFTLIEVIVVAGLIGVLLAFLLPATTSFMNSGRVDGASNVLVADVHYARSLATSQRLTYQIRFKSTGYAVMCVTPPSTVLTRTLPSGVTCAASDTAWFYPWGLTKAISVTFSNTHSSDVLNLAANGSVTH